MPFQCIQKKKRKIEASSIPYFPDKLPWQPHLPVRQFLTHYFWKYTHARILGTPRGEYTVSSTYERQVRSIIQRRLDVDRAFSSWKSHEAVNHTPNLQSTFL